MFANTRHGVADTGLHKFLAHLGFVFTEAIAHCSRSARFLLPDGHTQVGRQEPPTAESEINNVASGRRTEVVSIHFKPAHGDIVEKRFHRLRFDDG